MRPVLLAYGLLGCAQALRPELPRLDNLLERSFDIVGLTGSVAEERGLEERAPPAGTYSALIAIGASYSDNGHPRAAQYSASLSAAPYVGGRRCNGPIVFEYLATSLGATLFDYAFTGAFIDQAIAGSSINLPTTRDQTTSYVTDANGGSVQFGNGRRLVAYQVGINPLIAIWNTCLNAGNTAAAKTAAQASVDANAQAVLAQISSIRANTANCGVDFLVMEIPPLETIPNILLSVNYDQAKLATMAMLEQRFNQALINGANALSKSWSKVTTFKMRDLMYDMIYNPQTYGFTVGNAACTDGTTSNVCSNPANYLFWDTLHPTTKWHQQISQRLLNVL